MDTFASAKQTLRNDLYIHDDDCDSGFMVVKTEPSSQSGRRTARYHCLNCSTGEETVYDAETTQPTINQAGTTVTDAQQYTLRSTLPELPSLDTGATLVVTAIGDAHPAASHQHNIEVYSEPTETDVTASGAVPLPDFLGHIKSHRLSLVRPN